MDIHLPKVPHSWRELGREIGIIVIGVLIALFFEQLVQAWDWREKVRIAERAMRLEILADDGPQIYADGVLASVRRSAPGCNSVGRRIQCPPGSRQAPNRRTLDPLRHLRQHRLQHGRGVRGLIAL